MKRGEVGKFIVFEGIDASGKGTQIKLLHNYLYELSKFNHLVLTREPYNSKELRRIMSQDKDAYSNPEKCAELFINDRANHLAKIIQPNLGEGMIVLSDRYKYSTLAYQHTQGIDLDNLIFQHQAMPIPDLVFLIDIPIEVALERMAKQKDGREAKFESDLDFQGKLRENYLSLKFKLPREPIYIIDGSQPIEKVHQDIKNIYHKTFLEN
jgi:dTMP kinase